MVKLKKAFVTGATGFTGYNLVKALLSKGYYVKALVRKNSNLEKLKSLNIDIIEGDLKNKETFKDSLSGIDVVYHVAALYRAEGVPKEEFMKVNYEGTKNLLEASVENRVKRFVHTSTVGVQGEIKTIPAKEEDPYSPGDHYQESKLKGELIAKEFFNSGKIKGVIIRPVGIYGPGDMRFLKLFKQVNKGIFFMIGSGKVLYHMTYIDDLIKGMILAGEKEDINGEIFTIGGNEYVKIEELVLMIAKALNKNIKIIKVPVAPVYFAAFLCEIACRTIRVEPPIFRRRLDFFLKDRAFDISKAKKLLGYKPSVPLNEGLKITAEWYKKRGYIK